MIGVEIHDKTKNDKEITELFGIDNILHENGLDHTIDMENKGKRKNIDIVSGFVIHRI